jgi:Squalene-hopene cyclase C-terminal domain
MIDRSRVTGDQMKPNFNPNRTTEKSKALRALTEAAGLLRAPHRTIPLLTKIASDKWRTTFEPRHLYSYTSTTVPTENALRLLINWILNAQSPDGGIAAYYSLLTGYSDPYPEVTGYIIPTLYDFSNANGDPVSRKAAERATRWLLSLQMASGAFPAGLHAHNIDPQPSIFNTGQILQGLVRAHVETQTESIKAEVLDRAQAAGNWLAEMQQPDGSWTGPAAYQGSAHTYYSMVSWALAQLAAQSGEPNHASAADRNLDWIIAQAKPTGWIDGINLQGHPTYLHFIAYVIQGILECGILRRREDAIQAAEKPAWLLLRKFETHKRLLGTCEPDFTNGQKFSCLTGNAQMSCVWLRLFETTGDLRYLNAALKMNEMLKQSLPTKSRKGCLRGVAGSYPIWGAYQPMRFISWGAKFLADALMLEQRLIREVEAKFATESTTKFVTKPAAKLEASECA